MNPNNALAIEAVGLTRRFDDFVAVDGIDLSVEQGELFSLLGPNGAGKTTIIKMLCCLLRPSSGMASILGHDVRKDPIRAKSVLALSPQETALSEQLNAWENLSLMAGLHNIDRATIRSRSGELLEMMGLTDRASDKVKTYSGGMQRRLSIAMALVSDPEVLFLDEPTLGLDPQARRAIWEHIRALKGEKTVVLTTHYLEEADSLADRIEIIDEGKIVALGTAAQLKAEVADGQATVVEAPGMTEEALAAIQAVYPSSRLIDETIEIDTADVSLYAIQDILRPRGIEVRSSHQREVTLDDVFLELTGKQLRE